MHPAARNASQATLLADAHALPDLGTAPEFTETEDWFNTPGDRPLTLASLRGRVVLVDFWTYTCINCIRTLPYLKAWDAAYRKDGLTIVGVETPEFAFEKEASNVADAIGQFGLRYPVVQDNNMGTWNAYGNEVLARRLPDRRQRPGSLRRPSARATTTRPKRRSGRCSPKPATRSGGKSHPTGVVVPSEEATPETYLGTDRAEGWINGPKSGLHDYGPPPTGELALNDFAYSGIAQTTRSSSSHASMPWCREDASIDCRMPGPRAIEVASAINAWTSRRLKPSNACLTISTFSCVIAGSDPAGRGRRGGGMWRARQPVSVGLQMRSCYGAYARSSPSPR